MLASRNRLKNKKGKPAGEPILEPTFKAVVIAMLASRHITVAEPAHNLVVVVEPNDHSA